MLKPFESLINYKPEQRFFKWIIGQKYGLFAKKSLLSHLL